MCLILLLLKFSVGLFCCEHRLFFVYLQCHMKFFCLLIKKNVKITSQSSFLVTEYTQMIIQLTKLTFIHYIRLAIEEKFLEITGIGEIAEIKMKCACLV